MEFNVMSRDQARRYSYKTNIQDCIMISITDVDSRPNLFCANPHIKGILRLQFDDVERDDVNCMTDAHAEEIINFVNRYINEVEQIIVHCEAGISRSAGVCAALMFIINGDDAAIFDNAKFCPNATCYRSILSKYFGSYDTNVADEKFKRNILLWRKANGFDD